MEFLVLSDVLLFPGNPKIGAHLLDNSLCVITQMTTGLPDESDDPGLWRTTADAPKEGTHTPIVTRAREGLSAPDGGPTAVV
ncbi:hypothetical protein GCM10009540_65860 [Streptomyces turgidiscabies]